MFTNTLAYAGIGARKTPDNELSVMTEIGRYMAQKGWTLRSGGAMGADSAFEKGCDEFIGEKEIFLPWKRFMQHPSTLFGVSEAELEIAAKHHPAWYNVAQNIRPLLARNVSQILGYNLNDPVKFVICWTPNGAVTGGTGQAIRIANAYAIPVINMGKLGVNELQSQITHIVDNQLAA